MVTGCDTNALPPYLANVEAGAGESPGVVPLPCGTGQQKECGFTLNQSGGIHSCYRGVQVCTDGQWSACGDGQITTEPDRDTAAVSGSTPGSKTQTLSSRTAAICNPKDACDPGCYELAEPSPVLTPTAATPQLCDGAPDVAECTAQPGCAHSLCTAGTALSSTTCGTCASTVCSKYPACCGTSWDSQCVAAAYSLCKNSPPPLGLCDFGVYSLTTLTTANAPAFNGGVVGALQDVIIDTDAAGAFPSKVVTKGDLWIKNANVSAASVAGGLWTQGGILIDAGSTTTWTIADGVHAGRGLFLNGGNKIAGTVYASANYLVDGITAGSSTYNIDGQAGTSITTAYASGTIANSVTVTTKYPGQATPVPDLVLPTTIPSPAFSCPGTTAVATIDSAVRTLTPGNYGAVTMQNGAKLVLNGPGTYTFVALGGNYTGGGIQIGTPTNATGTYTVIVCGKFQMGNNANIVASSADVTKWNVNTPVLSDPKRLQLYVGDSSATAATFGTDVNFTGILSVPNGTFNSGNNNLASTVFTGAVWAKVFAVGTKFNLSQISKSDCEGLALTGTLPSTPSTCSVDSAGTSIPAILGSKVQSCRSGLDCQSDQRCIDVDTGSATANDNTPCTHSKCKPGAGLTAACRAADPCVERACAANAACCGAGAAAWSSACVDLVSTLCDAECGSGTSGAGTCVSNQGRPAETLCTGYDLSLGYACQSTTISVCNHGNAAFGPASVNVGVWDIAKRKFADTAPGTPDRTCTQSLSIAAGSCTSMLLNATNCGGAALSSTANYTFMVDPTGALKECGTAVNNTGRRLDNWSWRDSSFTCPTTSAYAQYEYLATCPSDTSAIWKNVSWLTNPNGAEVRFYAKVAKDVAALAAGSYTYLATAKAGPPNTAICSLDPADGGNASCVAPITTTLGLGKNPGQALSLRVELDGASTISKWEVSYTCQYDE